MKKRVSTNDNQSKMSEHIVRQTWWMRWRRNETLNQQTVSFRNYCNKSRATLQMTLTFLFPHIGNDFIVNLPGSSFSSMPELMAASSSLAYLFTCWENEVRGRWSCAQSISWKWVVSVHTCCTFSGDPMAILPSPRTANMRTVQQGSDILSIMLFINTSININSVTTWWFKS